MRKRSRARGWALQLLYAWEMRDRAVPLRQLLDDFTNERRIAVANRDYLETLIDTIQSHQRAIDIALDGALTNWRLERLSVIDRNILRIGAAEMMFLSEIPPRVSIQEGIALAEKYGTAESPRFVNGVLDALMRQVGSAADPTGPGDPR
ncbi:MAG: transcription antitermination factor NusB [Longimicrobiales bacterium]